MNQDVKLVLCDLDGTILNSNKQIPDTFYEVFEKLSAKGIAVGMATGRPVSNINVKFPNVKDQLSNVCENGGCVTYKGKILHVEDIPLDVCEKVVLKTRALGNCGAVLCALDATYIENTEPEMVAACKEYYPDLQIVDDLLHVDDVIVKLSIYDFLNSKQHVAPAIAGIDARVEHATSSDCWVDLMNTGVSKAKGIECLCKHMGITMDNVMAFGDEMNDYQMLKSVGYSYAMENAIEPIKEICKFHCESNDDDGVMKTLKREFFI